MGVVMMHNIKNILKEFDSFSCSAYFTSGHFLNYLLQVHILMTIQGGGNNWYK
jgi:hypothetical protein